MTTIEEAANKYIDNVSLARSANTARTYKNALLVYLAVLQAQGIEIDQIPCAELPTESISWFAQSLKKYSPATERLYLTAVTGFYEFMASEKLAEINLPRLRLLIRQRARRIGQRLPQFPAKRLNKSSTMRRNCRFYRVKVKPAGYEIYAIERFYLPWPIPACGSTKRAASGVEIWIGMRVKRW